MTPIHVRIDDGVRATLARAARRRGVTLGQAVRETIAAGLEAGDTADRLARIEHRIDALLAAVEVVDDGGA
ncbi:hypothetical protein KBTX_03712 [wastewater metagenome]|uniref:Ribbon-helix-helix protein CopG domain-containing protein n=2 Tax=unclassified sequences TaxID=12908 RepID=A0A5B8RI72_9ZZZZ|nr:hypothetical protein [Arhodomonas sp. KWT]QEA07362.1 hypothetical protein KBTEX_03712 [uncultured organism]